LDEISLGDTGSLYLEELVMRLCEFNLPTAPVFPAFTKEYVNGVLVTGFNDHIKSP